jgi:hypothetical protein
MAGPSAGRFLVVLGGILMAFAGCATGAPAKTSPAPGSIAATSPARTSDAGGVEAPPSVALHVEGGDPVPGQLGTFAWADGGSDSPWLPGEPIGAASGELLAAIVTPDIPIAAWSAVLAPSSSAGGLGASNAGRGTAPIVIAVPVAGSWTLAVTIAFGDLGSATYFWRLDVT